MTKPHLLLFGAISALLIGCNGGGSSTDSGSLTLGITDAPVDNAEAVVIQFSGIEIISSSATSISVDYETPKTLDLIQLQGGLRDTLLDGHELAAGQYEQLRLKVNATHDEVLDSYIQIDGAQHELWIPSGSESGLKLNHPFEIVAGVPVDLTIDFDLRKSVVRTGPGNGSGGPEGPQEDSPGYILKPTLRLIVTQQAGDISGTIADTAFTGLSCAAGITGYYDYSVYVYAGSDVIPDDLDGEGDPLTTANAKYDVETGVYSYKAAFLPAGNYTIAATCEAATDEPTGDEDLTFVGTTNVTVATGGTTIHNFE